MIKIHTVAFYWLLSPLKPYYHHSVVIIAINGFYVGNLIHTIAVLNCGAIGDDWSPTREVQQGCCR